MENKKIVPVFNIINLSYHMQGPIRKIFLGSEEEERRINELDLSAQDQEQVSAQSMAEVFSRINISSELKNTVKLLLLSEQNNIITAVLKKLNGDKKMWERAQKEPIMLLRLIADEQQENMYQLQRAIGAREERQKMEQEGRIVQTPEEKKTGKWETTKEIQE